MKEMPIQELKTTELEILNVFHDFCQKNHISYYLSHGTLLGAIRHGGFIPWDDDVDVLVPREDYDHLIELYQDDMQYRLFSPERNPDYRYPFAKLCDMRTRKEENDYDNGISLGVDIDIFPLDAWDDDLEKAKKEAKCISRKMFLLGLAKLKKADSRNPVKRVIKGAVMLYAKKKGCAYYIHKIQKESKNRALTGARYVGCKVWCVYGTRGIIPAEAFSEAIDVTFEGRQYPAPKGSDLYLTCLYGDYMPMPPREKQKTHHVFKAYWLPEE